MSDSWIVVRKWQEFQHYPNRDPIWIKVYTRLLHDENYLQLTPAERALLHGIWLLNALTHGQINRSSVHAALRMRASTQQWQSLKDAGFIEFSASKPLARSRATRSREKRREDLPKKVSKPKGHKTTGWREVRGSHGITHVPDPFGTDTPPIGRPM